MIIKITSKKLLVNGELVLKRWTVFGFMSGEEGERGPSGQWASKDEGSRMREQRLLGQPRFRRPKSAERTGWEGRTWLLPLGKEGRRTDL